MACHSGAAASSVFDVALRAVIDARRHALLDAFGWTQLDVEVAVDAPARRVRIEGAVLLPQVAAALRRDLGAHIPAGWTLDTRFHRPRDTDWLALLPGLTRLVRRAPMSSGAGELVTELLPGDGPVMPLASDDGATLVRTVDGTLGWTTRVLGSVRPRPRLRPSRPDVAAVGRAARSYLQVPYRLGGTTRRGIDCSGLVQRAMREAADVVVPRHSTDQVRGSGASGTAVGEPGDVVCIWSGPRQMPHVGLVLRGRRPADRTVVHASATARHVIEEPLDRFLAHADRVAHVTCAQAVEQASCLPRP